VPVSENPSITVTLNGPALNLPAAPVTPSKGSIKAPPPVTVSEGVVAQWDSSADEPNFDMEALGKDGKFNWVCSVPSQSCNGSVSCASHIIHCGFVGRVLLASIVPSVALL